MNFWDMIPPGMAQAIRADDAAQENKRQLEELERSDRAWAAGQMNQAAENNFRWMTGHSSSEYREAMSRIALARENRNPAAEYGSATRAAILVDGKELRPREQATGPVTMSPDSITAQLNRARQQPGRQFMQDLVADLERRERTARPAISRSEVAETIECLDCIADGNVTVDEYLAIHHGDDPLPETRAPDYAPAARGRRTARQTPMIYR